MAEPGRIRPLNEVACASSRQKLGAEGGAPTTQAGTNRVSDSVRTRRT